MRLCSTPSTEPEPAKFDYRAGRRELAEGLEQRAGQGLDFRAGKADREFTIEVRERDTGVDQPAPVGEFADSLRGGDRTVGRAGDFAEDALEQILHGHQAGDAAVLVDAQRE